MTQMKVTSEAPGAEETIEKTGSDAPQAGMEEKERLRLLETFIRTFLPAVPSRHRNLANEVHHVSTTLRRVMLQQFGIRVGADECINTFVRLHYCIFNRYGVWDVKKQQLYADMPRDLFGDVEPETMPASTGTAEGTMSRRRRKDDLLHVNVNPHVVRALRLTTIPLPANTNADKREAIEQLQRQIAGLRGRA
ncbi:MAG: hypothetical protein IJY00_05825 [Bacteroidaceae bacterium]|nr:hypothetical protein [Bacteroidaceae bacterium]